MPELGNVFSTIKLYVQDAPSKGFVSFEAIATKAGVSRATLRIHLESLKKMKLITYSATGQCFLTVTKLGMETKQLAVTS